MKHRRAFFWMGFLVFFLILGIQKQALSAQNYRVKEGDTLYEIAKKYGVSVAALKEANHLKGSMLQLKQVLVIPDSKSKSNKIKKAATSSSANKKAVVYYTVRKGDTLSKISRRQGISIAELKAMNQLKGTTIKAGRKLIVAKAALSELGGIEADTGINSPDVNTLEEDLAPMTDLEWAEIEKNQNEDGEFLGKWRNAKERELLVKVALGFLGAPYRSGGDTVRGLDSSGFIQKIYEIFDVNLPRTALEQSRMGKRVDRTDLQEGDLVFFHSQKIGGIVGIYIGDSKFVHAAPDGKREVRIGHLDEPYMNQHFIKAVRLKDLNDGA
ncbi:MAG: LysM peptidoglycan-binding domain-containing protein [Syntrophaceae bacterium]|nr:LysM peptidoglycan-binding domain-containing protein [Syntrophaceae bacterium]